MSSEPIMTTVFKEKRVTGNRILQFHPVGASTAPSSGSPVADILTDPAFKQNLKELVEGIVIKAMFEHDATALSTATSAFDSLLIIDLPPDPVDKSSVLTLEYFSRRIEDRSMDISFTDDME
jgi:hypothetical protein